MRERCSAPTAHGALLAGCALECVHCYSLVHDDLPAMDNDDLRRGRPTAHKAFDEATAILAGDALLTFAFDLMARAEVHADAAVRIALVSELARAAGIGGMAGGQMLDLAAEGRFKGKAALGENDIVTLQAMKTGALLRFACRAGAHAWPSRRQALASIDRYGAAVGQAFQIADDLLDVEGDAADHRQGRRQGRRRRQGDAGCRARRQRRPRPARRIGRRGRSRAGAVRRESRYLCAPPRVSSPNGGTDAPKKAGMARSKPQTAHRPPRIIRIMRARPRLFIAGAIAVVAAAIVSPAIGMTTRLLIGWDIGVALYLLA